MQRTTPLLLLLIISFYFFTDNKTPTVEKTSRLTKARLLALPTKKSDNTATVLTRVNFEDHIRGLYDRIGLETYNLSYDVFRLGMVGYYALEKEGALNDKGLLTIIDFARPSTEKRFFTIDVRNKVVKYHTYVAHGRNTGQNIATSFSNTPHSNQSSLGFYVTGETYFGSKGYSLRLDGKEAEFNDKIRSRAVVIHAADYVTENFIKRYGRLGRSQGCPALPPDLSKDVIDQIKNKSAIFTYYPDENYLNASRYLRIESLMEKLDQSPIELARTNSTHRRS